MRLFPRVRHVTSQHVIILGFRSCLESSLQPDGLRALRFVVPKINASTITKTAARTGLQSAFLFLFLTAKAVFTVTTPRFKD